MNAQRLLTADDGVFLVAIGIHTTDPGEAHTGVVYRSEKLLYFLHFPWDGKIEDRAVKDYKHGKRMAFSIPKLRPERARFFRQLCIKIAKCKESLHFALKYYRGSRFNAESGKMILAKESKGVNCATFSLAVFQSYGVQLVNEETWPAREDDAIRHKTYVESLRARNPAQAVMIEADIGCIRIRPQETAGACLEDLLPAEYTQCVQNGAHVMKVVQELQGEKGQI